LPETEILGHQQRSGFKGRHQSKDDPAKHHRSPTD
jgi:hypothetical protein